LTLFFATVRTTDKTAFICGLLFQHNTLKMVLKNPIAFIVEALVFVGVFAYLLTKWEHEVALRLVPVPFLAG